jgi:transcription elongation factor Elf1
MNVVIGTVTISSFYRPCPHCLNELREFQIKEQFLIPSKVTVARCKDCGLSCELSDVQIQALLDTYLRGDGSARLN